MFPKKLTSAVQFARDLRNTFFNELSKRRLSRIVMCLWVIGLVWIFADIQSGNFNNSFKDNLICLVLGIIAERLIPWGKTTSEADELLRAKNEKLLAAVQESASLLSRVREKMEKLEKQVNLKQPSNTEGSEGKSI